MIEELIYLSNGNPGAFACLMGLIEGDSDKLVCGLTIIPRIKTLDIRGTNLYVLWSDLCDKDYSKMAKLCKDCPDSILIDACSRQDYSGRELVKEYL
jgi:hypothetical protein